MKLAPHSTQLITRCSPAGAVPTAKTWRAYDERAYDGTPRTRMIGYGATEVEALIDYHEQVAAAVQVPA